ncbi:hypothetical protein GWK47_050123 [Chionoecetes opilio]|uniref:Uncharacterized protein n=1 Tax=Chionoecetes opilio TaxID=41210 RepID=A0A8J4Y1T9_CHIOP|nr:hypothetical protein GWK47_050123 [Chionoecetes opilio]
MPVLHPSNKNHYWGDTTPRAFESFRDFFSSPEPFSWSRATPRVPVVVPWGARYYPTHPIVFCRTSGEVGVPAPPQLGAGPNSLDCLPNFRSAGVSTTRIFAALPQSNGHAEAAVWVKHLILQAAPNGKSQ